MNNLEKIIPSFLHAVRFLSIFSFGKDNDEKFDPAFFLISFPLIGFALGLILVLQIKLFSFLPVSILGLLTLVVYLVLTRMLHVDGVADTVEGLVGGQDKEDRLRIMKDPRIGAFGVVALVVLLIGYWQFFSTLIALSKFNPNALASIVVAFTVSRWSMLLISTDAQPAQEGGLGDWFIGLQSQKTLWQSAILPLIFLIGLFHFSLFIIIALLLLSVWLIKKWAEKKVGGLCGDLFGFTLELVQILLLVASCVYLS